MTVLHLHENAIAKGLDVPSQIVCGLVAAQHVAFFILETYEWRDKARAIFRNSLEKANQSATLAANQGYYNLLLAVALSVGIAINSPHLKTVMCGAVLGAALFGALTVSFRILFFQGTLAAVGFLFAALGQMDGKQFQAALATLIVFLLATAAMGVQVGRREREHARGERARLAASDDQS